MKNLQDMLKKKLKMKEFLEKERKELKKPREN
jgi:hypothetical protein